MVRCIIVDDEPIAADVIDGHLQAFPEFQVLERFTNPIKAVQYLSNTEVDLIFLDVQMPGINGFELINSFRNPPHVIFTTAYPEHAINGFEANAIDYLLKPIPFSRFAVALGKVRERLRRQAEPRRVETDAEKMTRYYKIDGAITKVDLSDILYVQAMENYVTLHTGESKFIIQASMKKMEDDLPNGSFMRVHRSYIVNMQHLESLRGNILTINSTSIPTGRAYAQKVRAYVKEWLS